MPRHTLVFRTFIPGATAESLFAFHESVEALPKLTPPGARVEILGPDVEVRDGALHRLRIWVLGVIPVRWDARISEVTPPHGFTDAAERGPIRPFRHRHAFVEVPGGCELVDTLEFSVMVGLGWLTKAHFRAMFAHRHQVTERVLSGAAGP